MKMADQIQDVIEKERQGYTLPLRLRPVSRDFLSGTLSLLFPHFQTLPFRDLESEIQHVMGLMKEAVAPCTQSQNPDCNKLADKFLAELPTIKSSLMKDAEAIFKNDPAAKSIDEVILAYPGFYAIAVHRIAHFFYKEKVPIFPRLLAEISHRETGIDIHPGATIGESFSIDHGTGVVIGETSTIGARVRIFQGVTLGALSVRKEFAATKRHPTIEDDVVIYANATILGGNTTVGKKSIIGGNVWLTHSVEPRSLVTEAVAITRNDIEPESLLDYYL